MKRRQVLATLGAGTLSIAGCIGAAVPDDAASEPAAGDAAVPAVAVTDVAADPPDATLTVSVRRGFGTDRPARVEIAYTNTADEARTVPFQASPPFSSYVSADDGAARLALIPDDHSHLAAGTVGGEGDDSTGDAGVVPSNPSDGCWRLSAPLAVYGTAHYKTLSPGETIATAYTLLGHHANEDCLPAGTYRFEQADYLGTGRPWGFTVELRV